MGSRAHALSCRLVRSGGQILRCAKLGTAWIRVVWSQIWVRNVVGFRKICTIRRSWKFQERCTASLFGTTVVMAVHAPDSSNSLAMYETCISSVVKVLREGRRGGEKDFYITGGLNVELGLMCTDEKDSENNINHQHMRLSAFNKTKAKVYLKFRYT